MKGISKKQFDKFTSEMWIRLKEGEKKYGTEYKNSIISQAMLEEATDLANYSFMIYLKSLIYEKEFVK